MLSTKYTPQSQNTHYCALLCSIYGWFYIAYRVRPSGIVEITFGGREVGYIGLNSSWKNQPYLRKICPFDQTNLFLNIQHSPKTITGCVLIMGIHWSFLGYVGYSETSLFDQMDKIYYFQNFFISIFTPLAASSKPQLPSWPQVSCTKMTALSRQISTTDQKNAHPPTLWRKQPVCKKLTFSENLTACDIGVQSDF